MKNVTGTETTKTRSISPAFVALALTALVMILGNAHMCHRQSVIIEVPLLVIVAVGSCVWTARAGTGRRAWLRVGLSLLIAFGIQAAYLTWLHSDAFPRELMTPRARETEERLEARRAALRMEN